MAKRPTNRPSPIDVTVGRNVRIWRMTKGLSQTQLAARLGVTFQQVQKYEVGVNRIGTGRLVTIATVLDVPISALFEGANAAERSRSLLALVSDSRSFRLAHAFAAIKHNRLRLLVVGLVERIAASQATIRRRKYQANRRRK
jgi:transcriptional regulator with XRE-family HTH domain